MIRPDSLILLAPTVTTPPEPSPMRRNTQSRRRGSIRPAPESLEARELMAVQISETGGVLTILGDHRANRVEIYDYDGPNTDDGASLIEIQADGQVYYPSTVIESIVVDLKGGNDFLGYELGSPEFFPQLIPTRFVSATMGSGNDRVYTHVRGFAFEADPSAHALGPGSWTFRYDLGGGNDTAVVDFDADILGLDRETGPATSNLDIGISGGAGNDWIEANVVRDLRVELGTLDLTQRGGAGHDTLTVRSDGTLSAAEGSVYLGRFGDAGNDKVFGTIDVVLALEAWLDQEIDTGSGADRVSTLFRTRSRRPAVSA
jgi:hypothetical protein